MNLIKHWAAALDDYVIDLAWAPDGMVEGLEHESKWLIGVQWHPEDTAAVDRSQQRLYDAFVEQACALRPG